MLQNNYMIELKGRLLVKEKAVNEMGELEEIVKAEVPMKVLLDVFEISNIHEELDDNQKKTCCIIALKNGSRYWVDFKYEGLKSLLNKYRQIIQFDDLILN